MKALTLTNKKIWPMKSFCGQTNGQTDKRTDRQTDRPKTICPDLLMRGQKKDTLFSCTFYYIQEKEQNHWYVEANLVGIFTLLDPVHTGTCFYNDEIANENILVKENQYFLFPKSFAKINFNL